MVCSESPNCYICFMPNNVSVADDLIYARNFDVLVNWQNWQNKIPYHTPD